MESLNRDRDQSSTLVGHSIFVYGKDSTVVEQAIAAVSDLLLEYVSKDDKKRLAAELQTGWKRNNDEDVDKIPFGIGKEERARLTLMFLALPRRLSRRKRRKHVRLRKKARLDPPVRILLQRCSFTARATHPRKL